MSLYKPCILVMHALHLPFQYLKHLTIRGEIMLNGVRACVCARARACMYELYFYDFYVVVWNRLVLQIRNKKDLRYNAMICVKCLTVN